MTEREIFVAALELDPAARDEYLARACGDPDQRRRVAGLLGAHDRAGGAGFLQAPAVAALDVDATGSYETNCPADGPGTAVGPYKLLEAIGEGGMGIVYMAEQTDPVRRKVALKIIKPGMDTKQVVARFEAERQALALMDHPNIAKVHDAGATASGRPYFVMELVRGLPVTEYCDQARLPVADRLRLFVHICRAVQHAHQKGVIHRDIKPSNVLVTVIDGAPVPKVIDFGIAKAAGAALTDRTLFTGFHQLVGTPLYMSPEQAELSGVDVDTRSDVYSLGVLLYELLTGTTPFSPEAFRAAGLDGMRRIIREEEPPRPSRRLSTLAAEQSSTVAERRKVDPRQLGRLMRSELDWVVMKALEKDRNRRYDGAGAMAVEVDRYLADEPVQAAPPTIGYRVRKFARRHRAGLATGAVLAAAGVAVAGVIAWGVWDRASRRTTAEAAAATALDESAGHYRADRPEAAMASARRAVDTLAGVPGAGRLLADARQRVTDLEMAARLEGISLGMEDDTAALFHSAFREYGIDPAESPAAEIVERIRGRLIAADLVAGLDKWGANLRGMSGRSDPLAAKLRAIATGADADPWSRRVRDVKFDGTPDQLVALAGEIPVGEANPDVTHRLGHGLSQAGRRPEAEALLRTAARVHPSSVNLNVTLADLLRLSSSESARVEALGFYRAALAGRPRSPELWNRIAACLTDHLARPAEGAEYFREAIRLRPDYWRARINLSTALGKQGKDAEAEAVAREAVAIAPNPLTYLRLGRSLGRLGRRDEAAAAFRECVRFEPRTGEEHYYRAMAMGALGLPAEAVAAYKAVLELQPGRSDAYRGLGTQLAKLERGDEALAAYREAIRRGPNDHDAHFGVGVQLAKLGKIDESITAYREVIRLRPAYAEAHCNLGNQLLLAGQYAEALASLRLGHELGSQDPKWPYPSDTWVERARRLAALEPRLPAILAGTDAPADPEDAVAVASLLARQKRYVRAAELCRSAFAADQAGADTACSAASYAALAACGKGEDAAALDEGGRAEWRRQALEWLRAWLAAQVKRMGGDPAARQKVASWLTLVQKDSDFAGVRDAAELAKLPQDEVAEWRKFWADVQAAVESAQSPAPKKD